MKKRSQTLIDMVRNGNEASLRMALANGVSPDEANEVGFTSLMAAAERGSQQLVRILLDAGADVNAATSRKVSSARGSTALISAVAKGHMDIVRLLVEAGANVNAETTWGESPLYEATRREDVEMVKYLLAHGAKPTWVPTFTAIRTRRADILVALLDAGADPNWKSPKTEETLLGEAVRFTKDPKLVLPLLKSGARPNDITGRRCPLNYAAWDDNVEICDLLLRHGADVNKQDRFGRTALMDASFKGRTETVELLLAKGAKVEFKDEDGKTASDLAKENGHPHLLQFLEVSHGSEVGKGQTRSNKPRSRHR